MIHARAVLGGDGAVPMVADVSVAAPGPHEVLVDIKAAGICRTDLDALHWTGARILGHEGAGVVRAVGSAVERVASGDRVLLNWAIPCGCCRACARNEPWLCASEAEMCGAAVGARASPSPALYDGRSVARMFDLGTLCTTSLVDENACTPLPDKISFDAACIVGCSVMTGAGSVWNVAEVCPGQAIAVLGCGAVGLNVIQGARVAGAGMIVALDRDTVALARARDFGATHTVLVGEDPAPAYAAVRDLTGGGADAAFEATGVPALAFAPLELVRHGGAAVQTSGIDGAAGASDVSLAAFLWNKRYIISLYGACVPDRDFARIFAAHNHGTILLGEQIARRWSFDNVLDAFVAAGAGAGKQVVVFT